MMTDSIDILMSVAQEWERRAKAAEAEVAALRAALATRTEPTDRTPDADVHYDACHSTKCPCFIAGAVAGSATPTIIGRGVSAEGFHRSPMSSCCHAGVVALRVGNAMFVPVNDEDAEYHDHRCSRCNGPLAVAGSATPQEDTERCRGVMADSMHHTNQCLLVAGHTGRCAFEMTASAVPQEDT